MKRLILTFSLLIGILCANKAEIVIQIKRTEINVGQNGCRVVSGFDKVSYNGDGTIARIDRFIGCADPGTEECPPDNLSTILAVDQNGAEALPISVINSINQLIAVSFSNSGSGNSGSNSTQVWIYNSNGSIVGQYSILLSWSKVPINNGYELIYNITVNKI